MSRNAPAILLAILIAGCLSPSASSPVRSSEIIVTSEAGEPLAAAPNVSFAPGTAKGTAIVVFPERTMQTMKGIGTSFTESSAFVLAHPDPEVRQQVMEATYGESGANFAMARSEIGRAHV